jgi:aspartate/methionine/tyrosine aminotransferase
VLADAVRDPATHGYCLKSGTAPLLEAATGWYHRRFGVALCPRTQALSLIGAQEGLAHLLLAVCEPGDTLLMPSIAYPSYFGAAAVAGLRIAHLPLTSGYLPDFAALEAAGGAPEARVLLLNYPNNPTAAVATREVLEAAVAFCRARGMLLIHDNPYVDQVYEGAAAAAVRETGACALGEQSRGRRRRCIAPAPRCCFTHARSQARRCRRWRCRARRTAWWSSSPLPNPFT